MIEPLASLDDFIPGPKDDHATGWLKVFHDANVGYLTLQVVPFSRSTVVYYPQEGECVALIIDDETMQIVGLQIEDYDLKALR